MTDAPTPMPARTAKPHFDVGAAISATFSAAFGNFFYFAGIILGGLIAMYAVIAVLGFAIIGAGFLDMFNDPDSTISTGNEVAFIVLTFGIFLVLGLWLYNVIVRSAITLKLEKKAQFGAAVRAGLFGVFPLIVIGIILIIPIYLGYLLLALPGLFLTAMFYVVVPVIVFEGRGIGAMGRSLKLTEGYRWAIMGYFLVMGILATLVYLASALLGVLITLPFAFLFSDGDATNAGLTILMALLPLIAMLPGIIISSLLGYIPPAIAYVRLREIKEGGGDELLEVFE